MLFFGLIISKNILCAAKIFFAKMGNSITLIAGSSQGLIELKRNLLASNFCTKDKTIIFVYIYYQYSIIN